MLFLIFNARKLVERGDSFRCFRGGKSNRAARFRCEKQNDDGTVTGIFPVCENIFLVFSSKTAVNALQSSVKFSIILSLRKAEGFHLNRSDESFELFA